MIGALGLQAHDVPEERPGGRAARHARQHEVGRCVRRIQRHALLQHPYALFRPIRFSEMAVKYTEVKSRGEFQYHIEGG